jgi:hypothetical protein
MADAQDLFFFLSPKIDGKRLLIPPTGPTVVCESESKTPKKMTLMMIKYDQLWASWGNTATPVPWFGCGDRGDLE